MAKKAAAQNGRADLPVSQDAEDAIKHPKTYDDLVWVQCKGYRCMAFTDANRKWINFYTGKKLTDFVKMLG